jgi:hypothetical protein
MRLSADEPNESHAATGLVHPGSAHPFAPLNTLHGQGLNKVSGDHSLLATGAARRPGCRRCPERAHASLGALQQQRVRGTINGADYTSNVMPAGGGRLHTRAERE